MSNNFPIGIQYTLSKKSCILIKLCHYTETVAITQLAQAALDRAVYKESFDAKFKDFVEGLVVVLLLSLKTCTNMYLLSKLYGSMMRCFIVENPSLFAMRGRYSDRKSLKRCVSYCYLEISFLVTICILSSKG